MRRAWLMETQASRKRKISEGGTCIQIGILHLRNGINEQDVHDIYLGERKFMIQEFVDEGGKGTATGANSGGQSNVHEGEGSMMVTH